MPTYEYYCKTCHKSEEIIQKITEEPLTECPFCKEKSFERKFSQVALQFKGSGFYITDYQKQSTHDTSLGCSNGGCGCKT